MARPAWSDLKTSDIIAGQQIFASDWNTRITNLNAFLDDLQADYLSQTETTAQTIASNIQFASGKTLTMGAGAGIDEFSTDGTLAGNSDTALPTEKAVKTYVDAFSVFSNWTPQLYQYGNIAATVSGRYLKFGKLVIVFFSCVSTATGTAGQLIQVLDFPYAIATTSSVIGSYFFNDIGTKIYGGQIHRQGTNSIYFRVAADVNSSNGALGTDISFAIAVDDSLAGFAIYETTD